MIRTYLIFFLENNTSLIYSIRSDNESAVGYDDDIKTVTIRAIEIARKLETTINHAYILMADFDDAKHVTDRVQSIITEINKNVS